MHTHLFRRTVALNSIDQWAMTNHQTSKQFLQAVPVCLQSSGATNELDLNLGTNADKQTKNNQSLVQYEQVKACLHTIPIDAICRTELYKIEYEWNCIGYIFTRFLHSCARLLLTERMPTCNAGHYRCLLYAPVEIELKMYLPSGP